MTAPLPPGGLVELVARATPGPWFADGSEIYVPDAMGYPIQIAELVDGADMASMDQLEADASLIALAPTLALQVEAMRKALEMWVAYDEHDESAFSGVLPMLDYAKAMDATRAILTKDQSHGK